jgi:hypothetical protein
VVVEFFDIFYSIRIIPDTVGIRVTRSAAHCIPSAANRALTAAMAFIVWMLHNAGLLVEVIVGVKLFLARSALAPFLGRREFGHLGHLCRHCE